MNQLLAQQLLEVLGDTAPRKGFACERSLRVAAATLSTPVAHEVSGTTVVGVLGRDDEAAFRDLVASIADEHGLDATITFRVGSFSVRFTQST